MSNMHMKLIARPINITTELKVSDVGCIVIRTIFTCGVFCQLLMNIIMLKKEVLLLLMINMKCKCQLSCN